MNADILKLLQERYFLTGETKWEDIAKRVSAIYLPSFELIKDMRFIPSSPTLMNAATGGKRKGTLSSCFPMGLSDSIEGIYGSLKDCALTTRSGGGIGLDISVLRGSSEIIQGSDGRTSSGPLYFLENFDSMLNTVMQGFSRRGAGMALCRIDHPNILDFIEAKKDPASGRFKRFNFSIKVPDWFYKKLDTEPDAPMMITNVTDFPSYVLKNKKGDAISVKQLWDLIIKYGHQTAEPGIFNSDIAYKQCTVTNVDKNVICNPCSEFVNIPFSSCSLASMNLSKYIYYRKFDWEEYTKDVETAVRFLNNVIDVNEYPIEKIKDITLKIRPIGLGVMGLAHALMKMQIPYNSKEADLFTRDVLWYNTLKGMLVSTKMAEEKGCSYPALDKTLFVVANARFFNSIGRVVHDVKVEEIIERLDKFGIQNSCITSVAPTGSISYVAETSGGIEPVFALAFKRKIEKINGKYDEVFIIDPVFEEYLEKNYSSKKDKIIEEIIDNKGSCQKSKYLTEEEKKIFITSKDLTAKEHLDILQASASGTSLSCSKTVNMPKEATVEDVSNVYREAHHRGIIGVTVYREGSREGILVDTRDNDFTSGIVKNHAPKRPKEIKGEVHHSVCKKQKYYVVVGMCKTDAYEVFIGINADDEGDPLIPITVKEGNIEKEERGKYVLITDKERYTLTNGHSDPTSEALNRLISTSLRHGAAVDYICEQLLKTKGEMNSFAKVVARALKKYIKDGTIATGINCLSCGNKEIVYESGCKVCKICGWNGCN